MVVSLNIAKEPLFNPCLVPKSLLPPSPLLSQVGDLQSIGPFFSRSDHFRHARSHFQHDTGYNSGYRQCPGTQPARTGTNRQMTGILAVRDRHGPAGKHVDREPVNQQDRLGAAVGAEGEPRGCSRQFLAARHSITSSARASSVGGTEVERYFLEGRIKEVADYCEADVVNTYRVWLRYELFRGRLSERLIKQRERQLAADLLSAAFFLPGRRPGKAVGAFYALSGLTRLRPPADTWRTY
jgi:Predicted 3'-5' exonuclease related to the exonuclease domain of PolB